MWYIVYVDGEIKEATDKKMCPECFGTNEGYAEVCRYCGAKLLNEKPEVMIGIKDF